MDLDQMIVQAEDQERALMAAHAESRGYLRALRDVRAAAIAAAQHAAESPAEPIGDPPADDPLEFAPTAEALPAIDVSEE